MVTSHLGGLSYNYIVKNAIMILKSNKVVSYFLHLLDAKTIEYLLELNKDKQKEYLSRTVWFKRLSKPLEAFQPDQVMIVSKYDCHKDPNPLKNLEVCLHDFVLYYISGNMFDPIQVYSTSSNRSLPWG